MSSTPWFRMTCAFLCRFFLIFLLRSIKIHSTCVILVHKCHIFKTHKIRIIQAVEYLTTDNSNNNKNTAPYLYTLSPQHGKHTHTHTLVEVINIFFIYRPVALLSYTPHHRTDKAFIKKHTIIIITLVLFCDR